MARFIWKRLTGSIKIKDKKSSFKTFDIRFLCETKVTSPV